VTSRRLLALVISGAVVVAVIAATATWAVVRGSGDGEETASVEHYGTVVAEYLAASSRRDSTAHALARDHTAVLALDASGATLLAVATPELLADPASRDAVSAALSGLVTTAGLTVDDAGRAQPPPPVSRAPAWTVFLPGPGSRPVRDAASAEVRAGIRGLEDERAAMTRLRRQLAGAIEAVERSVLALAASAHAKGAASAAPEKASQEAKDAYAAAVSALATPNSPGDVLALVTGYRDAWAAAIASDQATRSAEEARRADSVVPTYIRGILIVNKTYGLPRGYGDGLTADTLAAFNAMRSEAAAQGLNLYISSGFRSYGDQKAIYDRLVAQGGVAYADRDTARPGHSEHQTGLTVDLNSISESFAYTPEGRWVRDNAHRFGFVIRYPQGKESVTGYIWEPWHLRYLGVPVATELYTSGLTLEEYLGVTSRYAE